MVSSAIAVLPVWRSPMISSRWPRPTGVRASIALRPVALGSPREFRGLVPAAVAALRPGVSAVAPIAGRVDDPAEQALAARRGHGGAGALDGLAFLDLTVGAENNDTAVVG